jgi:hypothetical protein
MEKAGLLPVAERRKIAAYVYSAISQFADKRQLDHLRRCAQACQAERWRLIAAGVCDIADVHFARTMITEQWLLARLELLSPASPVREILAERRCRAVEEFIRGNISFETAEIIPLHMRASGLTTPCDDAFKYAA